MTTPLARRYDDAELRRIIEQGLIYMCACPAQVAEQLLKLRGLHGYQADCMEQGPVSAEAHRSIAIATARAHDELENCLDEVLAIEGWDRSTLTMPEGLRRLRDERIDQP